MRNITSADADGEITFGATPPSIRSDRVKRLPVQDRLASAGHAFATAHRAACRSRILPAPARRSAPRGREAVRLRRRMPRVAAADPVVGGLAVDEEWAEPGGKRLASSAPSLPRSSPTTNSRPIRRSPAARNCSAAATCAARIPLASHAPRPKSASSPDIAGKERRDAIEVRRKDDGGIVEAREDIETPVRRALADRRHTQGAPALPASQSPASCSRPVVESMSISSRAKRAWLAYP